VSPDRDPDRRQPPSQPTTETEPGAYTLIVPGVVACVRCAALILHVEQAQVVHDGHHAALRELWDRTQPPPAGRARP
jgi:hypothetical protein